MKAVKFNIGQIISDDVLTNIEGVLYEVNGRAETFTITSPREVISLAERAELLLKKYNIPDSLRGGATLTYRPQGPRANSYKYSVISTRILLRRKAGKTPIWYLDEVARADIYPRSAEKFCITISDAAAGNLVKRTLAVFDRVPAEGMMAAA